MVEVRVISKKRMILLCPARASWLDVNPYTIMTESSPGKSKVVRQSLHLKGFQPEKMEEVIRGGRFEHFILSRSDCEVWHERWECGGFSVDAASYSFAAMACGVFAKDRICIGFIRGFTQPTWINGFECGLEAIQIYPPGCEINYRASPGCAWVAIEFDEAALQKAAMQRRGREVDLPQGGACNLLVPRSARQTLERMVDHLLHQTTEYPPMTGPILECIVDLLFHSQTGSVETLGKRWRHREALLAKAELYLRANLGRPFDGRSLARSVGATERCIQKHFHEAYGISPGRWARCLALHHTRKRLLESDHARFTVDGIAHHLGFHHMGRFAKYYQELFGEYPSATLAKSG